VKEVDSEIFDKFLAKESTQMKLWPWLRLFRVALSAKLSKELLLLYVTPLSLDIETVGGIFTH
jgi:molecular chaperone DnaK (HSP70)